MPETKQRERIAILGGGIASLAAAYELSDPSLSEKYEITLYQMGWRLGGKCASGRNLEVGCRIQEHGPHIFFGSYDNAFDVLRGCYKELARGQGDGFRNLEDALEPSNEVFVFEHDGVEWKPWKISIPEMPGQPGTHEYPSDWEVLERVLHWLFEKFSAYIFSLDKAKLLRRDAVDVGAGPQTSMRSSSKLHPLELAREALQFCSSLDSAGKGHTVEHHESLANILQQFRAWFQTPGNVVEELRHDFILLDLAITNAIGALVDGLLFPSEAALEEANRKDYREWLDHHGSAKITRESAVVRALYDLVFAYPEGDIAKPGNVEAGTSVRALTRMMGYRGPYYWKMRAGTADIVAAPLYELLERRGVRFRFFHRVDELTPSQDGTRVQTVKLGRQVQLKEKEYRPLVKCGELPCWPSHPLYDQIMEGEDLKSDNIDLESYWTSWQDTGGELALEQGRDFDQLVLGIPVEALKRICKPLSGVNQAWREMAVNLVTTQTQNVQLWFEPNLEDMGWTEGAQPVLSAYDATPLDTWFDASEVLPNECWGGTLVRQMSMLCGPMVTPKVLPPPGQSDYPREAFSQVRSNGLRFLTDQAEALWSNLGGGAHFRWAALVAPGTATGPERLDHQYIRPNINPSDRYAQTLVNTSRFRLRPDQSGFANMVVAGDWTNTGMNLGSFEAAVTSGRMAARAVSGCPRKMFSYLPAKGD